MNQEIFYTQKDSILNALKIILLNDDSSMINWFQSKNEFCHVGIMSFKICDHDRDL